MGSGATQTHQKGVTSRQQRHHTPTPLLVNKPLTRPPLLCPPVCSTRGVCAHKLSWMHEVKQGSRKRLQQSTRRSGTHALRFRLPAPALVVHTHKDTGHTHSSDTQKHTPLAHATSQQGAAVATMARQVGSRLELPQQTPCWGCCHGSVLLPVQLGACCALRADLHIQRIQLAPHRLQHGNNGQQHSTTKSE